MRSTLTGMSSLEHNRKKPSDSTVQVNTGPPSEAISVDGSQQPVAKLAGEDTVTSRGSTEPGSQRLAVPAKLGKYQLVEQLGKGGFGQVFRAVDTDSDLDFAIKILHDTIEPELLLQEARLAAGLSHPNIVQVHRVETDEATNSHYIVMEYVEGVTLESALQRGEIDRQQIPELMAKVADALAHSNQTLVHRDLKPSNIILGPQGPKITDFGLAIHDDDLSPPDQVAGTASYMSPEQVRGESANLDGRTDIWSFGVILYRMLTGRLPFRASTKGDLFLRIMKNTPKPPRQIDPTISEELEAICLDCLQKDVELRPKTAADLAERLRNLPPTRDRSRRTLLIGIVGAIAVPGVWFAIKSSGPVGGTGGASNLDTAAERLVVKKIVFPNFIDMVAAVRDSGESLQVRTDGVGLLQFGELPQGGAIELSMDVRLFDRGPAGFFLGRRESVTETKGHYQTVEFHAVDGALKVRRSIHDYFKDNPHSPSGFHSAVSDPLELRTSNRLTIRVEHGEITEIRCNQQPLPGLVEAGPTTDLFTAVDGVFGCYNLSSSSVYSNLRLDGVPQSFTLEE